MTQPDYSSRGPNILFLMDDQHRWDYLGCAGAEFVRTPHLDALARRGVRFSHCCTNAPVCAPARIGLATGLQPARLGALDNQCRLPPEVPTFYQRLRDAGCRVGCIGKLDLAKPDPYNGRFGDRPAVFRWGFTHPEECEGKMHAGASATPRGPYTYFLQERGLLQPFHEDYRLRQERGWTVHAAHDSVLPTDAFEDVYIGRRACRWIEQVPEDFPWFLFVSFVGPHDPYDPPAEYADRYRAAPMPEAIPASAEGKPAWVAKRRVPAEPEEIAVTRRQYCAAIELIDDQIGAILAALAGRGMAGNTCVLYTSDHGEMLGDHGLYAKSVAYEPALRVPLIVTGPGIETGRVSDALVELNDTNPTICELAGLPPQERIDARSFVPLLRGEATAHRPDTVSALRQFRCLRTERYKLIENVNDRAELYDMENDPNERENIAARQPELVRTLQRRLQERFLEHGRDGEPQRGTKEWPRMNAPADG
jgi:choline-sulfatase